MNIVLVIVIISIILILIWTLFGTGLGKEKSLESNEADRGLRRRESDKNIEDEFPDSEEPPGRRDDDVEGREYGRRKSDSSEYGRRETDAGESGSKDNFAELKIPYLADDIIPAVSRSRIYKRTLLNAEAYAKKHDIGTAISLYDGVNKRIIDLDMKEKIEADIEYLKNFEKYKEKEKEKDDTDEGDDKDNQSSAKEDSGAGSGGGSPQVIKIELADSLQIKEIFENLSQNKRRKIDDISPEEYEDEAILEEESLEVDQGIEESESRERRDDVNRREDVERRVDTKRKVDIERRKDTERRVPAERREDNKRVNSLKLEEELDTLKEEFDEIRGEINRESFDTTADSIRLEKELDSLKEELGEVKNDIDRESVDSDADNIRLEEELDSLKEEFTEVKKNLDQEKDYKSETDIADIKEKEDEREKEISSLHNEVDELKNIIDNIAKDSGSKKSEEKIESEDHDDSLVSKLYDEIKDLKDNFIPVVSGVPQGAPEEGSSTESKEEALKTDEDSSSVLSGDKIQKESEKEKLTEKEYDAEEEEDAFDLVKEYEEEPQDKSNLSDEEIFEKILADGGEEEEKEDNFEIIGDEQLDDNDIDIFSKDVKLKKEEDDKFYRNLIKTDKKLKKELPVLKVTFDFSKLPDVDSLSREKNVIEYSFYKYKDLLEKAEEYIKQRRVRDAINYYKVVMNQNIPSEFKVMIRKNIRDLTEYLEKYLME